MAADEKATVPEHLVLDESPRGFRALPAIEGTHVGDRIEVSESSSAEEPRLWVTTTSRVLLERGQTIVSLTAEDAWRLGEQLMTLVAGHYQGDARPAASDRVGDLLDTTAPTAPTGA